MPECSLRWQPALSDIPGGAWAYSGITARRSSRHRSLIHHFPRRSIMRPQASASRLQSDLEQILAVLRRPPRKDQLSRPCATGASKQRSTARTTGHDLLDSLRHALGLGSPATLPRTCVTAAAAPPATTCATTRGRSRRRRQCRRCCWPPCSAAAGPAAAGPKRDRPPSSEPAPPHRHARGRGPPRALAAVGGRTPPAGQPRERPPVPPPAGTRHAPRRRGVPPAAPLAVHLRVADQVNRVGMATRVQPGGQRRPASTAQQPLAAGP